MNTFLEELMWLINKYCKENESNTPDYILAEYLKRCLSAFDIAVNSREAWYGRDKNIFDNSKFERTVSVKLDEIKNGKKVFESLDQGLDI